MKAIFLSREDKITKRKYCRFQEQYKGPRTTTVIILFLQSDTLDATAIMTYVLWNSAMRCTNAVFPYTW